MSDAAEFLKALVQVPSDNPPGDCAAHAAATAKLLEGMEFVVERHLVPKSHVERHGMRSVVNLVVREKFGAGRGPTIALNAHGDAVPPGEGWSVDPYGGIEKDGAIYGRGAAVSKSDFATYAFALRALKADRHGLDGHVELHFTYDEEAGGEIGPKWLLEQNLTKPDLAICAGFSYSVVTAHNGCLHLEVDRARPPGPRGHAGDRRRRARGRQRDPRRALCRAQKARAHQEPLARHRLAQAQRRADLRRHQHQRRARPRHLPARPAHHPRGERRQGGEGPDRAHRESRQAQGHRRRDASGSCSPSR